MNKIIALILFFFPLLSFSQDLELGINLGHTNAIKGLRFSPDGKYLLSSSDDGTLKLWDVQSAKLLQTSPKPGFTFKGHLFLFPQSSLAAFSTSGELADGSLKHWVWNYSTNQLSETRIFTQRVSEPSILSLPGVKQAGPSPSEMLVNLMAPLDFTNGFGMEHQGFYPNATNYYVRSGDQMTFYNITDNQAGTPGRVSNLPSSFAFNTNGTFIFGSTQGPAAQQQTFWQLNTASPGASVNLPADTYLNDVSPDGKTLLVTNKDGLSSVYDIQQQKFRSISYGLSKTSLPAISQDEARLVFNQATFSPNGLLIARGGRNGHIYLHDVSTGKLVNVLKGHTQGVKSVSFSTDGLYIESSMQDNTLRIWDLPSGLVKSMPVAETSPLSLENKTILGLSDDQKLAVIEGKGNVLELWSVQDSRKIKMLMDNTGYAKAVFSPDKKKVFFQGVLNTMRRSATNIIWDIDQNKELMSLENPDEGENRAVCFSPDSQLFLLGTDQGNIYYYDLRKQEQLQSFSAYSNTVDDLAFSPDGTRFLSASALQDGTLKIWDIPQGKEVATLIILNQQDWVVIGANGLFDASSKAMNLLFYKIDYENKTEVIELEQLKARYYEPGLLQKLMGFSSERLRSVEGLTQLALYPQVKTSIQNDQLNIQLQERNGGLGQISVFANGKEIERDINPQRQKSTTFDLKTTHKYLFRNPDSTNIISLRIYNQEGWLKSSSIDLRYEPKMWERGSTTSSTAGWSGQLDPKMYMIAMGTSDYSGTQLDLQFAAQDATVMAKAMQSVGSNLFNKDSVEIYCLTTDANIPADLKDTKIKWLFADKENVKTTLSEIKQKAKAEDVLMVYLSGHGVTREVNGQSHFYYLTHFIDNEERLSDADVRNKYTISSGELTEWINEIPALKQVLVVDACNSGKVVENLTGTRNLNSSQIRALDRMKDRTGMFVLSGSAADKVSYEASEYGQGLLTYALLQGMLGVATQKDPNGKEVVDVMTLFQYARDEVPRLAATINGIQTPMLGFPTKGASFDIGIFTDDVNIPIGSRKPVVIRSLFMNQDKLQDDLNLVELIEQAFREETEEGGDSDLIYVDVNKRPGAYSLGGLYTTDGEHINITVKLFKGGQNPIELTIRPTNDPKRLARYIVREVKKQLNRQ